jgi:catechol 2,3-dioxygenase-like lactoylglutathione lyase family enzyme
MKVKRIVSNIYSAELSKAKLFYQDILGLELIMDHGWIQTFGSTELMQVQVSFATEGSSGTSVPDLSIEVEDLTEALIKFQEAGIPIEYGPITEPWGPRRFYVRDPFGKLVNILAHTAVIQN